jgi:hypothetical protein
MWPYLMAAFAEQAHGGGIGHRPVQPKAARALKRQAVFDLKFRCLIRQRIECLEHQYLEHDYRIERRPTAFIARSAPQRRDQWLRNVSKSTTAAPAGLTLHSARRTCPRSKKPGCSAISASILCRDRESVHAALRQWFFKASSLSIALTRFRSAPSRRRLVEQFRQSALHAIKAGNESLSKHPSQRVAIVSNISLNILS